MASLQDQPNPFAQFLTPASGAPVPKPSRRPNRPLRRSLFRFGWIVAAAVAIAILATHSPRYVAQYLSRDLEALPRAELDQRLIQIASLGTAGLPVLVEQFMVGPETSSLVCERLLTESQNGWTTLSNGERLRRHQQLLRCFQTNLEQTSVSRRSAVVRLLRQSMRTVTPPQSEADALLVKDITQTLQSIARPTESLADRRLDSGGDRLLVRRRPISIAADSSSSVANQDAIVMDRPRPADATWTQWPPDASDQQRGADQPPVGRRAIDTITSAVFDPPASTTAMIPPTDVKATEIPERATATKLTHVPDADAIVLRPVPRRPIDQGSSGYFATADFTANAEQPSPTAFDLARRIQTVSSDQLLRPMLTALADVSVFVHLHDPDSTVRGDAELELRSRGYDDAALALASIMGSPDPSDRSMLAKQLPTLGDIDPRPWLSRLCDDPDRDVRWQAIATVATFNDADARGLLRRRLSIERDASISARLRKLLDLR